MKSAPVMHVITGLNIGGAEKMLVKLLTHSRHPSVVVSLRDEGALGKTISEQGIPVHALHLSRNVMAWRGLSKLKKLIMDYQPAVVQSWLYASDLLAGYAATKQGTPVLWNIRQSETRWISEQWHIALNQRINARLSGRWPDSIVYCAHEAFRRHIEIGYKQDKGLVIVNGVDTDLFKPDAAVRDRLRKQWNVDQDTLLIGMVGRYDPLKNHDRFLQVISRLKERLQQPFRAVLVGRGLDSDNGQIQNRITALELQHDCLLLGEREDVCDIMNTLDLYLLTSDSEGWPNVLGEAMACAKPCVATDVGDVARLVGETGHVVDVDDLNGFVDACLDLLTGEPGRRQRAGQLARDRIMEHFSLSNTVDQYDRLYSTYME